MEVMDRILHEFQFLAFLDQNKGAMTLSLDWLWYKDDS